MALTILKRELMQSNALTVDLQPTDFTDYSVGETLRRIRVERGHSLEDVTKSTKIRTFFLVLLEENNFNELPGAVFTTGFIRNYCDYLNIPSETLISQYIIQCSKKEAETPFKIYVPQTSEKIITLRVILTSLFIIFIALTLWHLTQNKDINNIASIMKFEDIMQNKTNYKKEIPTKKDPIKLQVEANLNEAPSLPISLDAPKNDQLTIKSEPYSIESVIPSDQKVTQESKDFNIEAIEETWLKITNEQGVRLKASFLKKGEVFSLKPYQGNLISVGNAENVDFVQGSKRIKGSEYLRTANGFAESKKIVVPETPGMVQSVASDMPKSEPVL